MSFITHTVSQRYLRWRANVGFCTDLLPVARGRSPTPHTVYKTNPISSNHVVRTLARLAELCDEPAMGGAEWLNSRRVHQPAVRAGYRNENGALYLVVCDDPMRRGQTGFGRLGAKGSLHIG
jgi:hypothetical protein